MHASNKITIIIHKTKLKIIILKGVQYLEGIFDLAREILHTHTRTQTDGNHSTGMYFITSFEVIAPSFF